MASVCAAARSLRLGLLLAVAALALTAPSALAAKAEIQRPDEEIHLLLREHGFQIYATLYPERGVAVIDTQKGHPRARRGRWMGATYAVHIPRQTFRDGMNVDFGDLGSISGRFVPTEPPRIGHNNRACTGPDPVSEGGHFRGRISFKGDGGYLTVGATHATEFVGRSFELRCRHGHAENPTSSGLFSYLETGTGEFSNSDGSSLFNFGSTKRRTVELLALHHLRERTSTFKAGAWEWLPGEVATARWVEVSRVAVSTFSLGLPELHPETATVAPPFPFSGEGIYSRHAHAMHGNLSVSFLGLKVPLTDKRFEAGLCVFTRRLLNRVCE